MDALPGSDFNYFNYQLIIKNVVDNSIITNSYSVTVPAMKF